MNEEIKKTFEKVKDIIVKFGDGKCMFHTRDIYTLLHYIEKLEAENKELMSQNRFDINERNNIVSEKNKEIERLWAENKELREAQEWISVDTPPPTPKNELTKYIVNVNGYGVHIDRFMKHSMQFNKYYGYVTHYKPLPTPPEA